VVDGNANVGPPANRPKDEPGPEDRLKGERDAGTAAGTRPDSPQRDPGRFGVSAAKLGPDLGGCEPPSPMTLERGSQAGAEGSAVPPSAVSESGCFQGSILQEPLFDQKVFR
jgi:hypothetical protein